MSDLEREAQERDNSSWLFDDGRKRGLSDSQVIEACLCGASAFMLQVALSYGRQNMASECKGALLVVDYLRSARVDVVGRELLK